MSDLEICRLAYEGDLRALTEQVDADKNIVNKLDKVKHINKLLPGRVQINVSVTVTVSLRQ